MSVFLKGILFISLIMFNAFSAYANIEVKSQNVILLGDVKKEDGERLVRNLEIYRAVILAMANVKNKPDDTPLRIYAFKNERALNKFASSRGIAGLYTEGRNGPIFLTISKGGFKDDAWSSQVALHEYSHHVLHALSEDNYPRWYDEGFANYLSTFDINEDIISIGEPKANHGASLRGDRWMQPETVFSAVREYPRTRRMDLFYGQSWLYVHYMQNSSEISANFPKYLTLLKTANDPLQAFETAFEMSVNDFHKKARSYWNDNAFPISRFKASPQLLKHEMTTSTLSEKEAELEFIKARLNFVGKKDAQKVIKKLNDLKENFEESSDLQLISAEAAMIAEDYSLAIEYINPLLDTPVIDSRAKTLRSDIFYHKLWTEQFEDFKDKQAKLFKNDDQLKTIIQYFEEALADNKTDRTTNLHLLNLLGRSDAEISDIGLSAVELSYSSFITPEDVTNYLNVAIVMAKTGRNMRACDNYRYVKGQIDGYKDKNKNDDYERLILFEKNHPKICE